MSMDSRQPHDAAKPLSEAQFLAEAPLLLNLQKRAETATSLKEWAIARIQAAIYMARTSRIDEAMGVVSEIKWRFRGNEDAEVFFWIWMLQGIASFYQTGTTAGMPLLKRAWTVSRSFDFPELQEYVAAWAAHFCFTDGKHDDLGLWLRVSRLDHFKVPEASCRRALVVAGAFQICNDNTLARRWYTFAREIARSIGDRASIMASIENRALLRMERLWVEGVRHPPSFELIRDVENELITGLTYERVSCSESLVNQGPVARLRMLVLRQDYLSALAAIDKLGFNLGDSEFSMVRATSILRTWLMCQLELIESIEATQIQEMAASVENLDSDDGLVCWGFLADLASRYFGAALADVFRVRAKECAMKYEEGLSSLASELAMNPNIMDVPTFSRPQV